MTVSRRKYLSGLGTSFLSIFFASKYLSISNDATKYNYDTRVIGHRGCSATHNDNSIQSIKCAIESNADGVELDIQRTKDNKLILSHEQYLYNNRRIINIKNNTLDEIYNHVEHKDNIPTLDDALELIAKEDDFEFFVGLKQPDSLPQIIDKIEKYDLETVSTIQGWSADELSYVKDKDINTVLVSSFASQSIVEEALEHNIDSIMYHYTSKGVKHHNEFARSQGLNVGYWAISDNESDVKRGLKTNPDFVLTNNPNIAVKLLNKQ